ncbi:hypothetical protein AKJ45_02545 [candidate division MSBL1 archaeon SCGC-AAA261F19]|uniref:Uncharacterized protein n=1 Tax=candidate division MSBL1 archaeon SCGC-AAA261F19 TaxID=1698275 RepID=A0A133V9E1_9EURY|nr:hypothetical protein AKJ45_02545 [candidate division MSBL1 archaeon SCGC-AAA261F19]
MGVSMVTMIDLPYFQAGFVAAFVPCLLWRVFDVKRFRDTPFKHYHWGLISIILWVLSRGIFFHGALLGAGMLLCASEIFQDYPFNLDRSPRIRNPSLKIGGILLLVLFVSAYLVFATSIFG